MRTFIVAVITVFAASAILTAQQSQSAVSAATVPRLVRISGTFHPANGLPLGTFESVTLSIYADESGGTPLWQETQTIAMGTGGQYAVLMGETLADGIPLDLFGTKEPRWLGVRFNRDGESEGARTRLVSVVFALKASDADSLGGRAASEYALVDSTPRTTSPLVGTNSLVTAGGAAGTLSISGTQNYLGLFTDSGTLGDSGLYQSGGMIGLGTTTPVDYLNVAFSDASGTVTGFAVQNRASGLASYSGMLFYDQTGAVGQFQGFNNATHEYRVNNVASGGSINFMLLHSSKLFVAANGNIGIGTTTPSTRLDVNGNINVAGNINAKYQDVAEWVDTSAPVDPGTVVVIDATAGNRVSPASHAYDTRVAGAVSRQPGLVLGEAGQSKAMIAQSGRVKVKADARYGAIRIGDLLVTSPTPGHAMRSRPRAVGGQRIHRPGTILGKALEPLAGGKGEILVLLTLQ